MCLLETGKASEQEWMCLAFTLTEVLVGHTNARTTLFGRRLMGRACRGGVAGGAGRGAAGGVAGDGA